MFRTPDFLQRAPLFRRLIPSVGKRYARWFKPRFMIEHRHGLDLILDQKNPVDRVILTRGYWEKKQLDYLIPIAAKFQKVYGNLIFLDIGAHWGLYSMVMNKNLPGITVHAFEPDAINQAQLTANLLINDMLDSVKVHKLALSDREGEIYLTRPEKTNRGVTRVAESSDSDLSGNEVVDKVVCQPLDTILSITNAVFAAKIDVEGHEISVLKGMSGLLKGNHFVLQIEAFPENFPRLRELMTGLGYVHINTIDRDHYFSNSKDVTGLTG